MALSANDTVIPGSIVQTYPSGIPLIGIVESVASPNVVVNWTNGERTTYSDDGNATLTQITVDDISNVHKRCILSNPFSGYTPGAPNGLATNEGMIVSQFKTVGDSVERVVVLWTSGDISVVPLSVVIILEDN